MQGFDIDALMAIKNSFQGNRFQWIKTQDRLKLGKVVDVMDIEPGRGGKFIAILSDGSRIDTDRLSNDLMMVYEDQPLLSMAEIQSINYIPSLSDEIRVADEIPEEFKQDIVVTQTTTSPQLAAQKAVTQQTLASELFGMFELEDTDLQLTVSVKLPAKNLLKMMYSNSQNKEEFLNGLSAYINNSVTADSVKESLKKVLGQDKKKKADAITS
jgi:hypothetical protein